jgi:hypothetical protein
MAEGDLTVTITKVLGPKGNMTFGVVLAEHSPGVVSVTGWLPNCTAADKVRPVGDLRASPCVGETHLPPPPTYCGCVRAAVPIHSHVTLHEQRLGPDLCVVVYTAMCMRVCVCVRACVCSCV